MGLELCSIGALVECIVIKRLSRFTVKVVIDSVENVAYMNNTGRLREYLVRGRKGFCAKVSRGRYGYRLVGIEDSGLAILIDTRLHEKSFEILITGNLIPWLKDCRIVKRNPRVFGSTIDYLIQCRDLMVFVEVKSAVANLGDGFAGYPDAPTKRGRRQIEVLAEIARRGSGKAFIVFVAGIPRARGFKLICKEDKDICDAITKAIDAGVEFKAINVFLDPGSGSIMAGNLDLDVDLGCCKKDVS